MTTGRSSWQEDFDVADFDALAHRKIENLWSDGLRRIITSAMSGDLIDARRASIAGQDLPGTSTTPAFVHEELLDFVVVPPGKDSAPKPRVDDQGNEIPLSVEDWLGLKLANEGLLKSDDPTIAQVMPKSPAAKAQVSDRIPSGKQATGLEFRQQVAQLVSPPGQSENLYPILPGLMLGDVITEINGDPLHEGGNRGPFDIAVAADLAEQVSRSPRAAACPIRMSLIREWICILTPVRTDATFARIDLSRRTRQRDSV